MRALLCLHHRLGRDSGAPGATLALGSALSAVGWDVDYLSFNQVFGEIGHELAWHQLMFPWTVAAMLARRAKEFDVIDASTGDAWLWATLCPPRRRRPALVTRAHGLEHVAHRGELQTAREEGRAPSWRYPIYHGGLRLWEVRRSLRLADHCVMLNSIDRNYARDQLGVAEDRLSVMPNGIHDHFLLAPDAAIETEGPLRLCFVGSWVPLKGTSVVAGALAELEENGLDYELTLFGTRVQDGVLEGLPARARPRVRLIPTYDNRELPDLLSGCELLLAPSVSEGSSVALIEAMACGVAPVATRVGAAEHAIKPGENGALIEPRSARELAGAVLELAVDRRRLLAIRRAAQATARSYRWEDIAVRTVELYEQVLARRSRVRA